MPENLNKQLKPGDMILGYYGGVFLIISVIGKEISYLFVVNDEEAAIIEKTNDMTLFDGDLLIRC